VDEPERILKEAVLTSICLKGLKMAGVAADIQTEHLPSKSLQHYDTIRQLGDYTLKMESAEFSETLLPTYQIILLHIPDHSHRRENFKSYCDVSTHC
jgi:hypothetical protein